MSRFISDNHPKRGLCSRCHKSRLIKADLGIDAMLITLAQPGVTRLTQHECMEFKLSLCGSCTRLLTHHGPPLVNLASRGITKRLTRKQTEKAARKLARDLKKMQDDS